MGDVVATEATKVITVRASVIRPCPDQPRVDFDPERLAELASSLKELGQQVAVIVRELLPRELQEGGGAKYELIDGERRWRAAQMAWGGKATLRCEVRGAKTRDHQFLQSVVSNFGRQDHSPLETILAVKRVCAMPEYAELSSSIRHERVGALFARGGKWVEYQLRLLNLPDEVLKLLGGTHGGKRRLTPQVAQFIVTMHDKDEQIRVANQIVERDLKPQMAVALVRSHLAKSGKKASRNLAHGTLVFGSVTKIGQLADTLLDLPRRGLDQALSTKPTARAALKQRLDDAIGTLQQVREALR